jgi:hypothetical protein
MSELGSKGDIGGGLDEVCFTPMNGPTAPACPFGADTVAKVFLHHLLQILWAVRSTIE